MTQDQTNRTSETSGGQRTTAPEGLALAADVQAEVAEHRGLFIAAGVISLIIGTLAIAMPWIAGLTASLFIGALIFVTGVVQAFGIFRLRRPSRVALFFVLGVITALAGLAMLVFPLAGVLALSTLLTAYFLVTGLLRLIFAYQARGGVRTGWMIVGGLASLLLGGLIFSGLPGNAAWVLGLLVGVDLLFYGLAVLAAALPIGEDRAADREDWTAEPSRG